MSQAFRYVLASHGSSGPFGYGDALADQIVSAISLGSISVGERLPAEIELAGEFNVAVATLRKSLALLRDKGIVETRRGRGGGTFIVRVPFPSDEQISTYLASLSIVAYRDYGDEHTAIATGIARLACQRAHSQAISELRHAAQRLDEASTLAECSAADSRFHTQLGVVSQSPRLLRASMRLQSEILALKWSPAGAAAQKSEVLADNAEIVEAVAAHDIERAERAVEANIRKTVYSLIDVKLTIESNGADPLTVE
ncbi:FCD domain-containing protein [Brevibacterium sp. 'Marine']|uniref:FadR/GntR family transcriptional regulator n=1 Tax=Brevibacterium sp. 'Marine' TaxID=2725563 RepID=UPI00145E142E|nr:FCD domain-containing protein [Brevibacterium sp. 'Marine']